MLPTPGSLLSRATLLLTALPSFASATTRNYDFNITWTRANPDAAFERPVIGINGQWPIPRIEADVGDRIIINVSNQLGNESTSLHFHGLFMNGTTHMDGPTDVSQCAIPPGHSFTYNFTIQQPGTYWYHSHTNAQYPDGLRGPLIIHDKDFPYDDIVDEELILTLSDWYHDAMHKLIPQFLTKANPSGAEPVPQAALMNETQNYTIAVEPNKTYRLRVVNMAAFAGMYFWIEGHEMSIVEVDGVYTKQAAAEMVYISAAQRMSLLVKTKDDTSENFPIVASMDTTLFDVIPDGLNYNVTGWIEYDSSAAHPQPATVDTLDPFDDTTLTPYDEMPLLPDPDRTIELNVVMDNLNDGKNYAFFNNITWTAPKVPSLYTALSAGDAATDPTVYGGYTNSFVLEKGEIVQIVVNNLDSGRHPFHLHGHEFQAVYRSKEAAGTFEDDNHVKFIETPMRRDTLVIWPNGNMVLRFKADNPGVWIFHCHIEWHVVSGLIATFVEDPLTLQKQFTIPEDHLAVCNAAGLPTEGNAAANTEDYMDLTGQNAASPQLPAGFTTRGIVALVFSCISGILGTCVVAWYGLAKPIDDTAAPLFGAAVESDQNSVSPVSSAANGSVEEEVVVVGGGASGGKTTSRDAML